MSDNHYIQSRAALLEALKASVGTAYPLLTGTSLEDKAPRYYRFSYLPAGDDPATLGTSGQDEFTGLAQVDVCSLATEGFKAHYDMLASVRSAYSYSVPLTYGSTTVRITSVETNSIEVDNDLYSRTAVSIYFTYRIQRG